MKIKAHNSLIKYSETNLSYWIHYIRFNTLQFALGSNDGTIIFDIDPMNTSTCDITYHWDGGTNQVTLMDLRNKVNFGGPYSRKLD